MRATLLKTQPRFGPRFRPGLGVVLLCAFGLVAAAADVLSPGNPLAAAGRALQPPSPGHAFGTDDLGRDVLAMVIHGSRTSLAVGLFVALISALAGTIVGAWSGYLGGVWDDLLMRLTDAVQIIPRFFLVLVTAALFRPHLQVTVLLLGFTFWPQSARLLRAQVLSVRERDFVMGARAIGLPHWRILWRHVLPNALPVMLAATTLQVGAAILVEAGLSFLGLGDPNQLSWGYVLNSAQPLLRVAPWISIFPGSAIALLVLAVNLVGEDLEALMNPRLRRR